MYDKQGRRSLRKFSEHDPDGLLDIGIDVVRCHRLNKDCHPSATVRGRPPRRARVSKITQLEEKLDGLVSLLKVGKQSDGIAKGTTEVGAGTIDGAI